MNASDKQPGLTVWLDAIGVLGPGGGNWPQWRTILQDQAAYHAEKTVLPVLNVLPSAERRRTGTGVRIALACGMEALASVAADPAGITTVFTSSGGDGDNCHQICEALAGSDRLISPTRFHNSVHNAPSGYWGIASGAMLPSTSLCAHDASFAAGLLEAATQCQVQQRPVLLVAYDAPYPEPLHGTRPILDLFAVALLLRPAASAGSIASLALSLSRAAPSVMQHPQLEQLRLGIPAARCLPLLEQLALPDQAGKVEIEYLNQGSLQVQLHTLLPAQ